MARLVRHRWALVVGAAILAGVAIRVWVVTGDLGVIEGDEGVVGLMAMHALDGEFDVFFWTSYYSGTQEVLLTAALFAIAGVSVAALKAVPIALFAAAALVTWRIGLRTVGEPGARIGALLLWIWPPFFVFWSTVARSAYAMGTLCAAVALLLVLRLRERDSRLDAGLLGFTLGFGVWSTQQSLLVALPALLWLLWRRPAAYRLAWIAVPAALVGGAPWFAWNAVNGFKAVVLRSAAGESTTYFERFGDLFKVVVPEWFGLRLPYSLDWTYGRVAGVTIAVALLAGFAYLLVRRPRGLEPLLFVLFVLPFVYAASSYTYFLDEPRYLTFASPVLSLLVAWAIARLPRGFAPALLGVAALLTVHGLVRIDRQDIHLYGVPADMGPLISFLERRGDDRVLAEYWLAYRLTFETEERIIASPSDFVRYQPYARQVAAVPNPPYVFATGRIYERRDAPRLLRSGYRPHRVGDFSVYLHARD